MLYRGRLLSVFHLIMRGILCTSSNSNRNFHLTAAAINRSFGAVQPAARNSVGCFASTFRQSKRSTRHWRRSGRRTNIDNIILSSSSSSSFQLHSTTSTRPLTVKQQQHRQHGPVIRRSDAPTHLDRVEDAINSSLEHYQRKIDTNTINTTNDSTKSSPPPPANKSPEEIAAHDESPQGRILDFPPADREAIGVASNLRKRLKGLANSGVDCRRCWLQKRHCVCERCLPLEAVDADADAEDNNIMVDGDGVASGGGVIPNVNRLFLLTHHKEICLAVDTAKLILSTFPATTRLVVSGIGREFQPAMGEMLDAVSDAAAAADSNNSNSNTGGSGNNKCLILFPTEDAKTFDAIVKEEEEEEEGSLIHEKKEGEAHNSKLMDEQQSSRNNTNNDDKGTTTKGWDVIVIDGTWAQARKMHSKYFPEVSKGCLYRVQLSEEAVKELDHGGSISNSNNDGIDDDDSGIVQRNVAKGHQLRRHPIKWREISTLEATRLLLNDMHTDGQFEEQSKAMAHYQEIGNDAAKRQLGPPRVL